MNEISVKLGKINKCVSEKIERVHYTVYCRVMGQETYDSNNFYMVL